jgi:hypothetical protein
MSIVALHFLAVGGPTPKAYSAQPPAKTRDFPSVASGSRPQVSGERVYRYETVRALTPRVATEDPLAASLGISPVVQARAYV